MKSSKKLGVFSFGMLAGMSLPHALDKGVLTQESLIENSYKGNKSELVDVVKSNEDLNSSDYVYLSDIKYMNAKIGYGSISLDKYSSGSPLTLIVNGSYVTFDKGIFAHATSTINYDLTEYSDYKYFTTYYGVNSTSGGKGNGVKFYIYTSKNGTDWETRVASNALLSNNESGYAKIDISDAKYLRLYAYDNGANGNDHAVWCDSKLIKEGYSDEVTMSVAEYDELIKSKYKGQKELDSELELLVLQRYIVNKVGSYQIKQIYKDENARVAFDWLFNDLEMLRLYVMGGTPDGTYFRSFQVLGELYNLYKNDLNVTETSKNYGTQLGLIYKKMMISLSLTHSQSVSFWINSSSGEAYDKNPNISVATDRYAIYKKMLLNDKLHAYFEQLEVEEMRYIMNSFINDDEIEWLRDYIVNSGKNWKSSYQFMQYKNVNTALYRNDMFYGANREQWLDTYKLRGYDVANIKYFPKVFMIMNIGGVCWQISNVGQNMVASYGVPSTMIGQPSHVAYLVYDVNAQGNATWSIWNNVSGWQGSTVSAYTGHKSYYSVRLLNGWGNGSYASNNRVSYILLGQAALNDYDNYVKSKELVLLADTYTATGDKKTADKLLREALEIQSVNFDALFNLIVLHVNEKEGLFGEYNEDLYGIAELVTEKIGYYPLPMYDMLRYINNYMTDPAFKGALAMLENRTLRAATSANANDVLQNDVCRTMANYLLGNLNLDIASFKFDGAEGATLSLSSMFNNANPLWDFSLDGGTTWITVDDGNSTVLTKEQVKQITSQNDIKVHLIGVNYNAENIFTIDIKESVGLPRTLYANDWENKLMDSTDTMEWRYNEIDEWTSFKNELPNLVGDKTVEVRMGATGVYLPSASQKYTFTAAGEDDLTKSYVTIDHLKVTDFSSETVRTGNDEQAVYAIDGNINRFWHTSRTSSTDKRYIVIKLDKPMYISQLQYVPVQNYNYGVLKNGIISSSLDGENWDDFYTITNNPRNNDVKTFTFDEPVYTQYIRLKCVNSYDPENYKKADAEYFLSAAMINLFTDLTKSIPTAEVEYSRTETTARHVTVKLVNPSEEITITNNDGKDTYTFNKNGEFIFEYVDKYGNKGSTKAVVNWIVDYSFAFDGEDPYTIVLGSAYEGKKWEFSIDGGTTWIPKNSLTYKLTEEEIASLSAENDLKFRLLTENNDSEIITIDIVAGLSLPTNLYANDWENRILGVTDVMEWRIAGEDEWTLFKDAKPDLKGNKTVEVRVAAHGTTLRSSSSEFTFTDHNEGDKKYTYVSIDHLEVVDYSSETYRTGNDERAIYAIDGRDNTYWLTSRTTFDYDRYITIKLDEPKYVSMVQYKPHTTTANGAGRMINGNVYTSKDGENWTLVKTVTELANDDTMKDIVFDEPIFAQYVKIQATQSTDLPGYNRNIWMSASMINIYEDKTKEFESTVRAIFSTEEKTNQDVTVQLVSNNSFITVTNNGGSDTYVFDTNGIFTFEYVDEFGNEGTYTVEVTWIDKGAPEATIEYSTTDYTNGDVIATLVSDEIDTIKILNNDGKKTYTFTENGTFTFEFEDEVGNRGSVTAKVDWINREAPTAEVEYSIKTLTNKDVVVTLRPDAKVTITNNNGSDTYTFIENGEFTFEYVDVLGNKGSATAKVDWIDKVAPKGTLEYDYHSLTNKDVVVTLKTDKKVTITNNDGSDTHTFTENGEFTFEFVDEAGNTGSAKAEVSWIDKEIESLEVTYSTTNLTNQDVIASVEVPEGIIITNNYGKNTYTFTENGEFTFEFEDEAGNKEIAIAKVDWIDKVVPTAEIEYSIKTTTTGDVIVTLKSSEKVIITNNSGSDTHTFTENGEFTFEYKDEAGNTGTTTAKVDWIVDKEDTIEITYSTNNKTNQNVVATLNIPEGYTIKNNGGNSTYTFTENGEFTFQYINEKGKTGSITAKVDWIDKVAPTASIIYSSESYTSDSVIARLVNANENIKILNNNGNDTYVFTENGTFIFEFEDEVGNRNTVIAKVDWIKVKANVGVEFSSEVLTGEDVVATLVSDKPIKITNNGGSDKYVFTQNGVFKFTYEDEYGDTYELDVRVDWIDKELPTAEVVYSTRDITNKDVVVTLVNPSKKITITNNNGNDTYTFTENGTFVFEFVDEAGNKGTETVKVNWIDKVAPTAALEYDITSRTNKDVTVRLVNPSEEITIFDVEDGVYVFNNNGTYVFKFQDKAGNIGTLTAKVDWIDKVVPTATLEYDITHYTNQNVKVTLKPSENVTITNNGGNNTYTFTENGEFTFEYKDEAGNVGTSTAKVDWIIKNTKELEVTYSTTSKTNKDVVATIDLPDGYVIINEDGLNTHVFSSNGAYTFEYKDQYGNIGITTANVTWIDKEAPSAELVYSTKDYTNKDVVVTLVNPSEKITILNNNGSDTYTFTENGEFTFEFMDEAGNIGTIKAVVNWINKNVDNLNVTYSNENKTNKDVTATVVLKDGITITNNNGSNEYVFTENGTFTFEYIDKYGNAGTVVAKVDWIKKEIPEALLEYDNKEMTDKNVIVKLIIGEGITITNNNSKNTYTFTENGEFTFEYVDEYGNIGKTTAKVDWIDTVALEVEIEYDETLITDKDVVAKIKSNKDITIINNDGEDSYTFTENGEFTFEYVDKYGNTGSIVAKVTWINKKVDIKYDYLEKTNQDVTVVIDLGEGYKIVNNGGSNTFVFTENGTFTFIIEDQYGNKGEYVVTVDWIDKTEIIANITYDINYLTAKDVIATLVTNKEVTILNNNGSNTYTFTENGEFTFEYVDSYGNTGTATATVYWIKKTNTDEDENTEIVEKPEIVENTEEVVNSNNNTGTVRPGNSGNGNNKHDVDKDKYKDKNTDSKEDKIDEPVEREESKDYTLLKKVVISLPVIAILYYLVTKKSDDKEDEEIK